MYAYLDVPFCLVVFFIFSFLAFFFSFFSNDAEGGLFAADERLSSSSEKKNALLDIQTLIIIGCLFPYHQDSWTSSF